MLSTNSYESPTNGDYYQRRRREYERANGQAIMVRNTLLILAALGGVAGQFTAGTGRELSGVIAALLAALATAVTAFEGLIGFAHLRKLYYDAELNLKEAEMGWDAAGPDGDLPSELSGSSRFFAPKGGQWGQLVIERPRKAALLTRTQVVERA